MDYVVFCLVMICAATTVQAWLRWTKHTSDLRWPGLLLPLLGAGWIGVEMAGERSHRKVEEMILGFASTYALETELLGHRELNFDTPPDDPRYLTIIEAQLRWLKANDFVADIYTMKKLPDGQIAFMVDSETDYDHNGRWEGDREQRTDIGEIFDSDEAELQEAFTGKAGFSREILTDRWGTWVSAYVPLRTESGEVEGVLGVDFAAARWRQTELAARAVVMGILAVVIIAIGAAATVSTIYRADLDRRRAQEVEKAERRALRIANAELEDRVHERTAALKTEIDQRREAQAKLAELNARIGETARQAGKAEVANSVLHNVGNVLNSLNASGTVLSEQIHNSRLSDLPRAIALLRENQGNAGVWLDQTTQGKQWREFMELLATAWVKERESSLRELAILNTSIQHIRELVERQQDFAGNSQVVEEVTVEQVLKECMKIEDSALREAGITVKQYDCGGLRVSVDRVKLMQILVNLFRNAREAMTSTAANTRVLGISCAERSETEFEIRVSDTGCGIAPEHRARFFSHGFTTKPDGHGFGLHSSALAARELGGSLSVESQGLGCGSTFVLRLPRQAKTESEPRS
jgi:signal transduction histidine kinase